MNNDYIKGKSILVTGGTGSIGGEIVRQLLKCGPKVIRIFSRDEDRQHCFTQELQSYDNMRFLIGDIRDKDRLKRAIEDIQIVYHAAALKQVPACEYNPFEAVKTNVLGTQNLIECALEEHVEMFIAISTDKAVNPTSTMGATKLLAERLVTSAHYYRGRRKTNFCCVRLGNVLNSRGSLIPRIYDQIRKGGPVTVTDPEMTRFIMSVQQAVGLLLRATQLAQGGEVFVLKMPAINIHDLVKTVVEMHVNGTKPRSNGIKIKTTKPRPGEKLYEELLTAEEAKRALETEDLFIIPPEIGGEGRKYPDTTPVERPCYSSKEEPKIEGVKIVELIKESGLSQVSQPTSYQ